MKDECCGEIMTDIIGLRSKMYSFLIQNKPPIMTAKGVKTHVVKNNITLKNYEERLFHRAILRHTQNIIRSKNHNVQTERLYKIVLSGYNDKRHLLLNTTDTLPDVQEFAEHAAKRLRV